MIEIKGVTKYFKEKKQTIAAVQDIHVTISQGEIVGLLGKWSGENNSFTYAVDCT